MSKRVEVAAAIFLIGFGFAYFLAATQYPLGKAASPGPGLLPCILGMIFIGLAAIQLITLWVGGKSENPGSKSSAGHILLSKTPVQVIGIMILYYALLPFLGFSLSTFLSLSLISRIMGLEGWVKPLLLAGLTVALSYLLFVVILDVPLPPVNERQSARQTIARHSGNYWGLSGGP